MYCLKGYIARDEDKSLWFHKKKPNRIDMGPQIFSWFQSDGQFQLDEDLFPSLTWEDEPVKVELIIRQI